MLRDPRAKSKLRSFFHHWLKMDEGGEITKDDRLFPGFDQALVADLRTSLNLFIDQIVRNEEADYQDLLLSDFIFMNERLAGFYNAKTSGARGFEKVAFEPDQRSGVITHPYLLAHFAYRDNTSPIHRGVFLTRNVLGRTLHPPPEAVEFNDSEFDPDMTMREKVTELTKADSCQNCHSVINPLGFSLEHFDAVGRFRTQEKNAKPIDATAKYPANDGPVDLQGARDLAAFVADNDGAQEGFVIQLFNLIAKQPVQAYGDDTLDQLHRSFRQSGYNIHELVLDIAKISALHPSSQEGSAPAKTLAEAARRKHSPHATP
jgi:hypothetical protein